MFEINPRFPTLSTGQDAKRFGVSFEDPSIKEKMEGGYVVSRARHTRTPRKKFTSGFTNITNDDKATLQAFWNQVRGGSVIFDWENPEDGLIYAVRFLKMNFEYSGVGATRLWNVSFEVEEA